MAAADRGVRVHARAELLALAAHQRGHRANPLGQLGRVRSGVPGPEEGRAAVRVRREVQLDSVRRVVDRQLPHPLQLAVAHLRVRPAAPICSRLATRRGRARVLVGVRARRQLVRGADAGVGAEPHAGEELHIVLVRGVDEQRERVQPALEQAEQVVVAAPVRRHAPLRRVGPVLAVLEHRVDLGFVEHAVVAVHAVREGAHAALRHLGHRGARLRQRQRRLVGEEVVVAGVVEVERAAHLMASGRHQG
jgi:hypothetical protein